MNDLFDDHQGAENFGHVGQVIKIHPSLLQPPDVPIRFAVPSKTNHMWPYHRSPKRNDFARDMKAREPGASGIDRENLQRLAQPVDPDD